MTLGIVNVFILTAWLLVEAVPVVAEGLARRDVDRLDSED